MDTIIFKHFRMCKLNKMTKLSHKLGGTNEFSNLISDLEGTKNHPVKDGEYYLSVSNLIPLMILKTNKINANK